MSASPTTIPAVKGKLLELFQAACPEPTEVWATKPNEDHQLEENVYIAGVQGRREFKNIGAVTSLSREEDYTIEVEVEVYRQGTDGPGTEARMWEIVQALELTIAENRSLPTLASNNLQWGITSDFRQATQTDSSGVLASYTFGVTFTARI